MIDTQRIQSAPRCISGIAEVAATLARGHDDSCTHALEVTTCFPLDVETVGRVLEGLEERAGIEFLQSAGLTYLYIARPDDYNLRVLDLDHGEQLHSNVSLMKHLAELRSDEAWVKKVHEQHEILKIASQGQKQGVRRLTLDDFTNKSQLTKARLQSALNDLNASGYILIDIDESTQEANYLFPSFHYPKVRYQHNMRLLDELRPSTERHHRYALAAALLLTILTAAIVFWTLLWPALS